MRGKATAALIVFALAVPAAPVPASAQDMPGIEVCTKESAPDRRTGCLQSNIEYLVRILAKHSLDAEQKFAAAGREAAVLREQVAAAARDAAALRDQVGPLREQLAANSREIAAMREQVAADKAEVAALKNALAAAHTRFDQLKK